MMYPTGNLEKTILKRFSHNSISLPSILQDAVFQKDNTSLLGTMKKKMSIPSSIMCELNLESRPSSSGEEAWEELLPFCIQPNTEA